MYSNHQKNMVDRVWQDLDNVVASVEGRVHETNLIIVDDLDTPRVEQSVLSTDASSRSSLDGVTWLQNREQTNVLENAEDTPFVAAISRSDLKVKYKRSDETRVKETIEDGYLPPPRSNFDQQTHTYHK